MGIRPIRTEEDYDKALQRIDELIDCAENSQEENELEIISLLVWDYEEKHYPIGLPDPIEAIKIRMQDLKLQQSDLADAFGGRNRASQVLNRKRRLTVPMIRQLSQKLGLSAEVLIQEYPLASEEQSTIQ